jgi:hypothetical protein
MICGAPHEGLLVTPRFGALQRGVAGFHSEGNRFSMVSLNRANQRRKSVFGQRVYSLAFPL